MPFLPHVCVLTDLKSLYEENQTSLGLETETEAVSSVNKRSLISIAMSVMLT